MLSAPPMRRFVEGNLSSSPSELFVDYGGLVFTAELASPVVEFKKSCYGAGGREPHGE